MKTSRTGSKPDTAADPERKQTGVPFSAYIERFRATLRQVFTRHAEHDGVNVNRALPGPLLAAILADKPFSVFIPAAYGGRGGAIHESLALLETASYESLPLGLTFGINWALFLQPVSKYAGDQVKSSVFTRFLEKGSLGGLMITEPEHGTDALNMQTSSVAYSDHYHIRGTKHWGGLSGLADYWLITAREQTADGNLRRDISFYICDARAPGQSIVVDEYYESLGLFQIPYGRNRVDVVVPRNHRLESGSSGVKMMLDMLHRSRMEFPGMGHGFISRMLDEAITHCRNRSVGGKSLISYDQVQERLARLQASFTVSSAMCVHSSESTSVEEDLSARSLEANSVKTVVSDMMHGAAQSLLQLVGAKGYRRDHIAGSAVIDSRPFQIFEGSNDVLYAQISETVIKMMDRAKESNLFRFLRSFHLSERVSDSIRNMLNFRLDSELSQRKLVDLGRALGRIFSMEWVMKLGDLGFRQDLTNNGLAIVRQEVAGILDTFTRRESVAAVDEYSTNSSWLPIFTSRTADYEKQQ